MAARSTKRKPKADAIADLIAATKAAPTGGRASIMDLPAHESARQLTVEYLVACREQGCAPSYRVLEAHLFDEFGITVSARTIRDWASRRGLS